MPSWKAGEFMKLAGAFASGGGGLPQTKQEKRVAAEIAEIQAFDSMPKWASAGLLSGSHGSTHLYLQRASSEIMCCFRSK